MNKAIDKVTLLRDKFNGENRNLIEEVKELRTRNPGMGLKEAVDILYEQEKFPVAVDETIFSFDLL